ncbi:hypothetical protein BV898_05877 [Hypsibius exemplaris]|uniref:Uncharacterized protein n=1 Tax=Hypsibius exemplaris TaxID=2072580 RepID=A0A1W0WY09_HYPEX|nr:hypothetical protein BV898_05877 [Hypsibius exemplaris]
MESSPQKCPLTTSTSGWQRQLPSCSPTAAKFFKLPAQQLDPYGPKPGSNNALKEVDSRVSDDLVPSRGDNQQTLMVIVGNGPINCNRGMKSVQWNVKCPDAGLAPLGRKPGSDGKMSCASLAVEVGHTESLSALRRDIGTLFLPQSGVYIAVAVKIHCKRADPQRQDGNVKNVITVAPQDAKQFAKRNALLEESWPNVKLPIPLLFEDFPQDGRRARTAKHKIFMTLGAISDNVESNEELPRARYTAGADTLPRTAVQQGDVVLGHSENTLNLRYSGWAVFSLV